MQTPTTLLADVFVGLHLLLTLDIGPEGCLEIVGPDWHHPRPLGASELDVWGL